MEIIPAIDIIDGKCVRLTQGDYAKKTTYEEDPVKSARKFQELGCKRLHLVDLDGAKKGKIVNLPVLEAISRETDLIIDFGGGISSETELLKAFDSGASMVTGGSISVKNPDEFHRWLEKFGPEKIILGADTYDGQIRINGWQEGTSLQIEDFLATHIRHGVTQVICTDISRDGKLKGPGLELYQTLLTQFPQLNLIASGGVSSIKDLENLKAIGIKQAIVGKAFYEGRISEKDLLAWNSENRKKSLVEVSGQNKKEPTSSLAKRIIPCLDIKGGRTVKGVNFRDLRDVGDPVELACKYVAEGADELVFLDISATQEERATTKDLVTRIAREINLPFTVGGGIRSVAEAGALLAAGADKISINSAAILQPELITNLAAAYGSQAVVVAIDAKPENGVYQVYRSGGQQATSLTLFEWAREAQELGAGEILFTAMDRDGTRNGFACAPLAALSKQLSIPVIASGGAGKKEDFLTAFETGKADAALAASLFHFGELSIPDLKNYLAANQIPTRL